jgi:2-oxoglutarate ferredoxin oxidoreductase subunit alpha
MAKILMKGNEAIGEAAIRAGCLNYFAYPITPQSEVAEYLSKRMPEAGGMFLQGESEVAVWIHAFWRFRRWRARFHHFFQPRHQPDERGDQLYGRRPCARWFLSTLSAAAQGLGGILPSQGDYFQSKGGGHGDYRLLVMAPASVQEAVEMVMQAFPLAEKYRNPVMILGDGLIGQMMEPVEFPEHLSSHSVNKDGWASNGMDTRKDDTPNLVKSLYLDPQMLNDHNLMP